MSGGIDDLPGVADARSVVVVVAHPDDETLWAGGLMLSRPSWSPTIISLCRASDPDRAPKFQIACRRLGAVECRLGDLDDGPDQVPLPLPLIEESVLSLLPRRDFDLLITHSPEGEYTRHLRHEETARAVARLWADGRISPARVWMFAYEDSGRTKPPEAIPDADLHLRLPEEIFLRKYALITEVYGFDFESWEARAVPRIEGFWELTGPDALSGRFASVDSGDSHGGT